jgi:hypothetical protein
LDEAMTAKDVAVSVEGLPEVAEQRDTTVTVINGSERPNEGLPGDDDGRKTSRREESRNEEEVRRSRNIKPREHRARKNPIAAQRERELDAERERQKEKAAQEKERRTQNYNKRVKQSPPTKAMKLYQEPVEQLNSSPLDVEPNNWFAKLVKWLRG